LPELAVPVAPQLLKLASIAESPFNPRTVYDAAKLAELAESIRTVGLLEPIRVRRIRGTLSKGKIFQVVYGHRRLRAHKLLKSAVISACVVEATDEQVSRLQMVENLQREDLDEIAEGEALARHMKAFGKTADALADEIGLSKGYVYARMKLTALGREARKHFAAGALDSSLGLLIARVPASRQSDALRDLGIGTDGVLSYRQAQELVKQRYMIQLGKAPFKLDDTSLGEIACKGCPKNTDNMLDVGKRDGATLCTDLDCYRKKLGAVWARKTAAADGVKLKVLPAKEIKSVFPFPGDESVAFTSGYTELAKPNFADPKHRSIRQLAGKQELPIVLARHPTTGRIVELVEDKVASDVLKAAGLLKTTSPQDLKANEAAVRKQAKQRELDRLIERELRSALAKRAAERSPEVLIGLVAWMLTHHGDRFAVLEEMGIKVPLELPDNVTNRRDAVRAFLRTQEEGQLLPGSDEILFRLGLDDYLDDVRHSADADASVAELCRKLNVDRAAAVKRATAALKKPGLK
jgi:ParB/RepB/Spo0J family partition protein